MAACCTDQRCSRFIQDRLLSPYLPAEERTLFLNKLLFDPSISFEKLVLDKFGNYII